MSVDSQKTPRGRHRYLFGPVPSRRLGRSLGIDLVPPKTCTYDCVFCQAGRTTKMTVERKEYVPVREVLKEFDSWLAGGGTADCVTLAGSGEPTLCTGFGDVISGIRERCQLKTVLLSNGSLFWIPEVRADASKADLVKVSLSAWDEASFTALNRRHPDLDLVKIVGGLTAFRNEFQGEYWLEVFIVAGINDTPESVKRIAAFADDILPDRIHVNTAVRPPADKGVRAVSRERLQELAAILGPRAEVVARFESNGVGQGGGWDEDDIMALVLRHPCTVEDVAAAFGLSLAESLAKLSRLEKSGRVRTERVGVDTFYYAA